MKRNFLVLTIIAAICLVTSAQALKVFILAGQSNMEGFGVAGDDSEQRTGSLRWLVNTPALQDSFPSLVEDGEWKIVDQNGDYAVREDAWIYYRRLYDNANIDNHTELYGGLSAGYGFRNYTIGPEFGFGHVMGEFFEEPYIL